MVDIKKSKCYRLFSLPYRPLAINMVINNENTVIGYDNCGYSYIGKLGEDFKVCLVSFNPNEETTCLIGTIDFDKKRINYLSKITPIFLFIYYLFKTFPLNNLI